MSQKVFSELFLLPFLAGLGPAIFLPWIGNYLRLREEWLATLGLAHLSTAGALLAQVWHWPGVLGALLLSILGVTGKQIGGGNSNSAYALMLLAGWSSSLLLAANLALGDALTQALIDGQLYFAGQADLLVNGSLLVLVAFFFQRFGAALLRHRWFPSQTKANRQQSWRCLLLFDLFVAAAIAAATSSLGLMAGFALIFVPSWVAFRLAGSWRQSGWLASGLGVGSYLLAFVLALLLDQPFGPLLAVVLLVLALLTVVWQKCHWAKSLPPDV